MLRFLSILFSIVGVGLMTATTVSFEDASSHLGSWVRGLGLDTAASGIPASADVYGFTIGALMLGAGLIVVLARRAFRNKDFVPLKDVAGSTLVASRGRSVEPHLKDGTKDQDDSIRRTAEAITRFFPMWGRFPGTDVMEEIAPATHSVYLDNNGALYAADNFVEREQAFIDLLIKRSLAKKIIKTFQNMDAPPFKI